MTTPEPADRAPASRVHRAALLGALSLAACTTPVVFAHSPDAGVDDASVVAPDAGPVLVATFPGVPDATWRSVASPSAADLRAVWGAARDDVWAVGASGTVLHWDGAAWSVLDVGTHGTLDAVWGSSASDVWIAGWESVDTALVLHGDGARFVRDARVTGAYPVRAAWGPGPDDIWLAGGDASDGVVRYDGAAWTPTVVAGQYAPFLGLAGTARDDVWAVEANESVIHWTGAEWRSQESPFRAMLTGGVWLAGYDDAFFAGASGELYRDDHGTWTRAASGGTETMHAIAGTSVTDVWAAGDAGAVAHWDGARWSRGSSALGNRALWSAWASAHDDAWIVGDGGTLLHLAP